MHVRNRFNFLHNTAEGAGAPAAPAATPAGAAPASAADIAKIVAEAVKAQMAPALAEIEALKSERANATAAAAKAAGEVASVAAAKATTEEQLALLSKRFGEEKAKGSLGLAVDRYQYASPAHREAARELFKAQCVINADGAEVVATVNGKQKPIAAAYDEWFAAVGAIYKAASAQPGPGLPTAAPVTSGVAKRPKDMTSEEFAAHVAAGVEGKLTGERNAPVFRIGNVVNHWDKKLQQTLASVTGRNGHSK